jgi:glycosyltransferase involved in cell wall biosynthesis
MKFFSPIIIFAHVPPPHHGQSYMVQLMLEGLKQKNPERKVYHVNAQVSDDLADVGSAGWRKMSRLIGYCGQALHHRFFRGARILYYIPAPAKTSAIIRDVVALVLLRPFFPRLILHWHAVGLGEWVEGRNNFPEAPNGLTAKLLRPILRYLLSGADPAICIASGNVPDAEAFAPRHAIILPNGIPDPCSKYDEIGERRGARTTEVRQWLDGSLKLPAGGLIHVAYLGHCLRSKGFFDVLVALRLAAANRPDLRWQLDIAGAFMSESEAMEGQLAMHQLKQQGVAVNFHGFLKSEAKEKFLKQADILLFPSWSESFGLVAVEAFAHGLPVIGSDIPGIRSVLIGTGCATLPVSNPEALASALCSASSYVDADILRKKYEESFTLEIFQKRVIEALR